ncbi:MAG: thiamine phosphate synthase [Terriglobales bacterium]
MVRPQARSSAIQLPRFYAIVDAGRMPQGMTAVAFAEELMTGGATLLQYRNKTQLGKDLLAQAQAIKRVSAGFKNIQLIMNDRADFAVAANFNGVHLGQDDFSPRGARMLCRPPRIVGLSTHNDAQVIAAETQPVDYIAIGPVFSTESKANPDPVVGLDGVRRARALTTKPLVAIGGITLANCREVIAAGADTVAVISELLKSPRKTAEEFIRLLG